MNQTAFITGAGSGVGRATAIRLLKEGWRVALIGRREESLRETQKLAGAGEANCLVHPCDIGDANAVQLLAKNILDELGSVEVLVNAAGTNTPDRSLEVLSLEDYHRMIDTNLHGAYYCAQAFLPDMRRRQSGTIVNIVSDSAKQASAKAGPAYAISKFGMAGFTQCINAEERARGIRACSIFPGEIDTPLLDKRPNPPPAASRKMMLTADDIAECVLLVVRLPAHAVVEEILIRPR
jgi:NADP-dependent 3-hydroxy acid dehydrogenase YdfG